ncbi:uncharacterized protein LOC131663646 [Phymastichus coffea]|uniref:uncharacterized protein LOC131663646 n=1 Tax=Phymastichus coffea TaxID=108790 RepID=UPI00273CF0DF|nr:uncharacterized protein LOC131663646 [Phymastichus coffea]
MVPPVTPTMEQFQTLQQQLAVAQQAITELRNANQAQVPNPPPQINASYGQPKIPAFSRVDVNTWFLQAEITLLNTGIIASPTKADFIAEKLDIETLQVVSELLQRDPRPDNLYQLMKDKLIAAYSSSAETRLRRMMKGQVPTDGKPSLIITRLKALNTGATDNIIQSVFLEQLPAPCRAALAVSNVINLETLSEMADKYAESAESDPGFIAAVNKPKAPSLESQLAELTAQVAKLEANLTALTAIDLALSIGIRKTRMRTTSLIPPQRKLMGYAAFTQIDMGADVSLISVTNPNARPSDLVLYVANGTPIKTCGEKKLSLDLHLGRPIVWNFIVAAVPSAYIGADLIDNFGLLVDVRGCRLIDSHAGLSAHGYLKSSAVASVKIIDHTNRFANIVSQYPEVSSSKQTKPITTHDIFHYIETSGSPVAERARRLDPEKYKAAQAEFDELIKQGICLQSKSPWASPIHMTRKKDGTWRICGEYRRFNAVSKPDKFPVPHLHDYPVNLHGKTIFSKLDLHRAYNQIPVAPVDVIKTAMIAPFGLFEFIFMASAMLHNHSSDTLNKFSKA